jgi:hypothetical protein
LEEALKREREKREEVEKKLERLIERFGAREK